MGSLILTMHVSADGYMADKDGGLWPGFGWPPEVHATLNELYRESSAVVYGRGTYETVVPFWTKIADGGTTDMDFGEIHQEYAAILRPMPKYVVSTTLDEPGDGIEVIRQNPAARIAEIVAAAEGSVLLLAGPRLTAELVSHGLLDEALLIVGPVLLGDGRRLIGEVEGPVGLRLLDARTYPLNMLVARYAIDRGDRTA